MVAPHSPSAPEGRVDLLPPRDARAAVRRVATARTPRAGDDAAEVGDLELLLLPPAGDAHDVLDGDAEQVGRAPDGHADALALGREHLDGLGVEHPLGLALPVRQHAPDHVAGRATWRSTSSRTIARTSRRSVAGRRARHRSDPRLAPDSTSRGPVAGPPTKGFDHVRRHRRQHHPLRLRGRGPAGRVRPRPRRLRQRLARRDPGHEAAPPLHRHGPARPRPQPGQGQVLDPAVDQGRRTS